MRISYLAIACFFCGIIAFDNKLGAKSEALLKKDITRAVRSADAATLAALLAQAKEQQIFLPVDSLQEHIGASINVRNKFTAALGLTVVGFGAISGASTAHELQSWIQKSVRLRAVSRGSQAIVTGFYGVSLAIQTLGTVAFLGELHKSPYSIECGHLLSAYPPELHELKVKQRLITDKNLAALLSFNS